AQTRRSWQEFGRAWVPWKGTISVAPPPAEGSSALAAGVRVFSPPLGLVVQKPTFCTALPAHQYV
ncbi:MAG: hypothetical protein ACRD23_16105, partial [Terriglobales bacterium]